MSTSFGGSIEIIELRGADRPEKGEHRHHRRQQTQVTAAAKTTVCQPRIAPGRI